MFEDTTQPNQGNQNSDEGAAPPNLPIGGQTVPTPPTPGGVGAEDIFDGVDNRPAPALPAEAPLSPPQAPPSAPATPPPPPVPEFQPAPLPTPGAPAGQIGLATGQVPVPQVDASEIGQAPPTVMPGVPAGQMTGKEGLPTGKKIIIIIVSIILVVALAALGFWAYERFLGGVDDSIGDGVMDNDSDGEEDGNEGDQDGDEGDQDGDEGDQDGDGDGDEVFDPGVFLDTDGDGLTDEEELALGTDINNPDSDEDGLTDRQEIEIYKTDPLEPDTDGDGYVDGNEVDYGYDPMGPGRLDDVENGGGDSLSAEGQAAYISYLAALESGNFEMVKDYMPQEAMDKLVGVPEDMVLQTLQLLQLWMVKRVNLEIVSVEESGGKVTIKALDNSKPEVDELGSTNKGTIILYKEGEQWKIEKDSWGGGE
ncbi:hypothetical protein HQ544_04360 [Candidatus Falkowbacteria bacterium]|nr:hypothetical protein [Candidatus Falkowbacteria bacterium]